MVIVIVTENDVDEQTKNDEVDDMNETYRQWRI